MRRLRPVRQVEKRILLLRSQKVLLDRDLADLYEVPTKSINLAVKRNRIRFPGDFMFRLSSREVRHLRFQIETSSWGGSRYRPFAFTEQGVAMLSSVLRSDRAALVNIAIMRAFVRMREVLASHGELAKRLGAVERRLAAHDASLGEHAEHIRSVFDAIRALMAPAEKPRKRIGFVTPA